MSRAPRCDTVLWVSRYQGGNMENKSVVLTVVFGCIAALAAQSAFAQEVKITPLGSHDGELCPQDRALVFEDPNGTRILFDAGRTVAGPTDPRLGKIDIILVTHMHGDHVGNAHSKAPNSGTCESPDISVSAMPNSNSVNIAVAKKSKIVTGSEMPPFFAAKLASNGLDPDYIGGELGKSMKAAGIAGDVGQATGYVLTFSNGLVVHLSGDTGITADQERVVRGHYNPKLVVMNIGGTFTTGPKEAAYVINELVKPNAVIPSHVNEVATKGGKVVPGSKTDTFLKAVKVPAHLPLSGKTMSFDNAGKCVAGC